jgi:predicted secreted protein
MTPHLRLRVAIPSLAVAAFVQVAPVLAEQAPARAQVLIIDLSAQARQLVANDLALATVYIELQAASPAAVAKEVNAKTACALQTARAYPTVKTQSAGTTSWPVYDKDGRRIIAWRMRSELKLESHQVEEVSALLGRLEEQDVHIGQVVLEPAPQTRLQAENAATIAALQAFQNKAKLVAQAMNKSYRIRQMSINAGQPEGGPPLLRMKALAADASAPMAAGESAITVLITGQIELPID